MKRSKINNNPASVVNLWERLTLELKKDEKTSRFITRIEDIEGSMLIVESPVRLSGNLNLEIGQQLEVVFNRQDAAYAFEAVVSDIDPQKENMTTLQPVSDIKRSQRRRFVRIDIAGDITFRVLETKQQHGGGLSLEKKGELLNISAGGILINTKEKLKQDDIILMNFWLKNSQRLMNILGIAKRVERSDETDSQAEDNIIGIEFLSKEELGEKLPFNLAEFLPPDASCFNEALQQVIVQFVYRQQVEARKKIKAGQ